MVCGSAMSVRIAGGFVLVPVSELMHAWRACRSRPLGIGDFRTWLACREMVARRCLASESREVRYGTAELAKLLGVTRSGRGPRSVGSGPSVSWCGPDRPSSSRTRSTEMSNWSSTPSVGVGARWRSRGGCSGMLAAGARPALVATALGILLRCLSRRKGGFDGRGRVKASWIASVFGVDERRVKAARVNSWPWLDRPGALEPASREPLGPGLPDRPGLETTGYGWSEFATPPRPRSARDSPPLLSDPEPLPERAKNQEPAGRGPAGALDSKGRGEKRPGPDALLSAPASEAGHKTAAGPDARRRAARGPPRRDPADRTPPPGGGSSARQHQRGGRLRFLAAAGHARAVGTGNTPGLFAQLVRRGWWHFATDDEDAARANLRQHDRASRRVVEEKPRHSPTAVPSQDAAIVRAVRAAVWVEAGIFRDPWPEFHAKYPDWDRPRWDAALVALGLA